MEMGEPVGDPTVCWYRRSRKVKNTHKSTKWAIYAPSSMVRLCRDGSLRLMGIAVGFAIDTLVKIDETSKLIIVSVNMAWIGGIFGLD